MFEIDDLVEIEIKLSDFKIDVFCLSGVGG